MCVLQNHYDGKSEVERRKYVSKDDLRSLFYSNKTTFSFKNYVTKMRQTFNAIKDYNVTLYKEEIFRQILDKINCQDKYLITEVNICRSIQSASFETASTYLSTVI